jgi:hypothetical protein
MTKSAASQGLHDVAFFTSGTCLLRTGTCGSNNIHNLAECTYMHGARKFHARAATGLRSTARRIASRAGWMPALMLGSVLSLTGSASADSDSRLRFNPNRTVPAVAPPPKGMEFPANPTTQDIFRARVFEERLVPIGAEP